MRSDWSFVEKGRVIILGALEMHLGPPAAPGQLFSGFS